MFKKLPQLITILTCALFATTAAAADQSIHIEWGYTPPNDPPLAGFNLYQEGTLACSTNNPDATALDCEVSLEKDSANFTLTAIFSDNSESPHSAPFPFSISEEQVENASSSGTGSHSFTFHWESTSSATSYRVYLNNQILCQTEAPDASTITCNTDLVNGPMTFSMTEVSSLGVESSPSNLLVYDPTASSNFLDTKQVQLTWEYPTEKGLAGFRMYQNNLLLCETSNPATRQLTCMAKITNPVVEFNIAAVDSNNNETLLSNTLTYTREDQTTNTVASTSSTESSLPANTSSDVSNTLTSESYDITGSTLTTIPNQPIVYTAPLFTDGSESTILKQATDDYATLSEATAQTNTATSEEELSSFNLEVGEISINAQWKSVTLTAPFRAPIVIAKLPTTTDLISGTVHLRNITSTGFEIIYTEPDNPSLDDVTVHYMVMEQGRFFLNQTTLVEAGSFSGSNTVEEINFVEPFVTPPVVLTTIATNNQPEALYSQLTEIETDNFQYSLQTPEVNTTVTNETIHYIAWEQGSGILDTIMYNADITNVSLTNEDDALNQQTLAAKSAFFFPCELTSIDQTATDIAGCYLAITPSENEKDQ